MINPKKALEAMMCACTRMHRMDCNHCAVATMVANLWEECYHYGVSEKDPYIFWLDPEWNVEISKVDVVIYHMNDEADQFYLTDLPNERLWMIG